MQELIERYNKNTGGTQHEEALVEPMVSDIFTFHIFLPSYTLQVKNYNHNEICL